MEFKYHKSEVLLKYVGKNVIYLDNSGNKCQSLLLGNGKRTWLQDVACLPFADTVLIAFYEE